MKILLKQNNSCVKKVTIRDVLSLAKKKKKVNANGGKYRINLYFTSPILLNPIAKVKYSEGHGQVAQMTIA